MTEGFRPDKVVAIQTLKSMARKEKPSKTPKPFEKGELLYFHGNKKWGR